MNCVVGSERRVRKAAVRKESSNTQSKHPFWKIEKYWCRSSSNKEVILFRSSVVVDNSLEINMGSGKQGIGIMLVVLEGKFLGYGACIPYFWIIASVNESISVVVSRALEETGVLNGFFPTSNSNIAMREFRLCQQVISGFWKSEAKVDEAKRTRAPLSERERTIVLLRGKL